MLSAKKLLGSEISELTVVTCYKSYYKNSRKNKIKNPLKKPNPLNINIKQVKIYEKRKRNIN